MLRRPDTRDFSADEAAALRERIAQARAAGWRIACVVDEAHHGFQAAKQAREFFARVLKPDYAGRAGEILDHAAANGLLMLNAGPDVLRFVPSLNITDEELGEGLLRLRAALQSFVGPPAP